MRPETVFYWFTFLRTLAFGFTATLYVPWLHSIGLTLGQISLLNAAFWIGVIVFEVPTGMIADGRGRGYSVTVGTLIWALGALGYSQVTGFWGALTAELFISIGNAFISGALSAWIADAPDRRDSLEHVHGHAGFLSGVAMVSGALVAVPIVNATFPSMFWVLKALCNVVAFGFALRYMCGRETGRNMNEWEALRQAIHHARVTPALAWSTCAVMTTGLYGAFNMYWTLVLLTRFTETQVSWVWGAMYGALAASGWLVRTHNKRLAQGRSHRVVSPSIGMVLSLVLGGTPLMLFGWTQGTTLWLVLAIVHEAGRGLFQPHMEAFLQTRVRPEFRATYGSIQSFLGSLGMVGTLLGCWLWMDGTVDPLQVLRLWLWIGVTLSVVTYALFKTRAQ